MPTLQITALTRAGSVFVLSVPPRPGRSHLIGNFGRHVSPDVNYPSIVDMTNPRVSNALAFTTQRPVFFSTSDLYANPRLMGQLAALIENGDATVVDIDDVHTPLTRADLAAFVVTFTPGGQLPLGPVTLHFFTIGNGANGADGGDLTMTIDRSDTVGGGNEISVGFTDDDAILDTIDWTTAVFTPSPNWPEGFTLSDPVVPSDPGVPPYTQSFVLFTVPTDAEIALYEDVFISIQSSRGDARTNVFNLDVTEPE